MYINLYYDFKRVTLPQMWEFKRKIIHIYGWKFLQNQHLPYYLSVFRILEIVFLLLPAFPLSLKGCQREMIKRSACPHQSLLPVCFVSRSHTLWFWFCDKEETTDTPFQTFRLPSIVFLTFNWRLFYKEITLKVYKAFCYSNFHSLA